MNDYFTATAEKTQWNIMHGGLENISVSYAGIEKLHEVLNFQNRVYETLPEKDKNFILLKDAAFFQKHMNGYGKVMVLYNNEGEQMAQAIIHEPDANDKSGMVDMQDEPADNALKTILQGVLVAPEFRGYKLSEIIVGEWLQDAENRGRKYAMAEVVVDNTASMRAFLHNGVAITSVGVDKTDGCKVLNMMKYLGQPDPFAQFSENTALLLHPAQDFDVIRNITQNGYSGIKYNRMHGLTEFVKK